MSKCNILPFRRPLSGPTGIRSSHQKLDLKTYRPDTAKPFMHEDRVVLSVSTDVDSTGFSPFDIEAFKESAQLMRALYDVGNQVSTVHGIRDQYNFFSNQTTDLSHSEIIKETHRLIGFYLSSLFYDSTKLPLQLPRSELLHVEIDIEDYVNSANYFECDSIINPDILSVVDIDKIKEIIHSRVVSIFGSIPVVCINDNYHLVEDEVFLDEELVAAELAKSINAKLLIVTNLPGVLNDQNLPIPEMVLSDVYSYLENKFDDYIYPKIRAAANHAESGGITVITDYKNAMQIINTGKVEGTDATVIAPGNNPNAA